MQQTHSIFEVPRNTYVYMGEKLMFFYHMDGAYAKLETQDGAIIKVPALTDVKVTDRTSF